ncbi:hypothetical protein [Paenibacillus macerans]|uniref:hypothetical protein n=1 Tax=Paenibacillus macerans TaxID=44252 RepID=UPI003D31251C
MPHSAGKVMLSLSLAALMAGALLTGCMKDDATNDPVMEQTGSLGDAPAPGSPEHNDTGENNAVAPEDPSAADRDRILEQFKSFQAGNPEAKEWFAFFDAHLAGLPPEDADMLMQKLLVFYEEDLLKTQNEFAEEAVIQALSELGWPIPDERIRQIRDEAVRGKIESELAGGYKLETAEGSVFPVVDYGALKKYNAALSEKMQGFIALLAMESDSKLASDAALSITWDELAERAVAYERYFDKYAGTPEAEQAKMLYYSRYLRTYLYGLDNTPNFDYETYRLSAEAKASYENTVKAYKGTRTAEAVQEFLDVLEAADWQVYSKVGGAQTEIPEVKAYRDRVLSGEAS